MLLGLKWFGRDSVADEGTLETPRLRGTLPQCFMAIVKCLKHLSIIPYWKICLTSSQAPRARIQQPGTLEKCLPEITSLPPGERLSTMNSASVAKRQKMQKGYKYKFSSCLKEIYLCNFLAMENNREWKRILLFVYLQRLVRNLDFHPR